ncbi:MAG: hypothetical protein ACK506_16375 [Pirellula sp.]
MNSPKPQQQLTIRLIGVLPEDVSISHMSKLVAAVQSLTGSELRLNKVRRTSAAYVMFSEANASSVGSRIETIAAAVKKPQEFLESSMLSSLDKITKILESLSCKLEVFTQDRVNKWLFKPKDWLGIRGSLTMEDEAVILGELQRVGGAKSNKCSIRVPFQKELLYCKLENPQLARKLGNHLYSTVELKGRGKFFIRDWKLVSFLVTDFVRREPISFSQYYKQMRENGGAVWDDINPELFIQELR